MYILNGVIKSMKPTEKISEKFSKREFVIEDTSGQYPNPIPLQFQMIIPVIQMAIQKDKIMKLNIKLFPSKLAMKSRLNFS